MSNYIKCSLLVFSCALVACTNTKENLAKKIYALEISDSSSTPKGMDDLANLYFDYAQHFKEDSIAEKYMFKGFMFKYITKHWDEAIRFSTYYKTNFPVSEATYMLNLKLADLYNTGKPNQDSAIHYYLLCDGKVSFSMAEKRNAAYALEKWSLKNITAPKGAQALFTAGKLFQMSNEFLEAVRVYKTLVGAYPTFKKSPDALMATGFIYWENLKDLEQAKFYYQQLVEAYPNHPLSKEAQTILSENILNMTDLELANYLTKKNKGL